MSNAPTQPTVPDQEPATGTGPVLIGVAAQTGPAAGLAEAVESWRARLSGAGVACRGVALHSADPRWQLDFASTLPDLQQRWQALRDRVDAANPVLLSRAEGQPGADLLVASVLQLPDGRIGCVGVALAPPHNERTVQLVLLSLGWLQLAFSAGAAERGQRASRLLELLGHVASQSHARSAAQEWVNRTAAWVRDELHDPATPFSLTLFEVRKALPTWWVAADTAWAETASPTMQQATEVAAQAVVEMNEVAVGNWWAAPVVDDGAAVAVLVARIADDGRGAQLPPRALAVLRASLGLAEPLLRRWQLADRSLPRHLVDSVRTAWRKVRGPGHLAWKAGAAGLVVALAVLLVWPVPDRVSAQTVIEGRVRQMITAPFEGFIGQVLVRPGARVERGQLMLRLDDRELKLEQSRFRGEREQAAAKLRQAMSDRDSSAMALALAEAQQADAQLALVRSKLERSALAAPIDGLVVTGDWVQQVGSPVESGKELFEVAGGDGYRLVLHVPDREIARVRIGQSGTLRLTGQPQQAHEFRVANVTATASVQDGVNGFRVEADWVGAAPPLSPGMQGVGKIEVGTANLLTVWTRSSIDWLRLKLWSWWW